MKKQFFLLIVAIMNTLLMGDVFLFALDQGDTFSKLWFLGLTLSNVYLMVNEGLSLLDLRKAELENKS